MVLSYWKLHSFQLFSFPIMDVWVCANFASRHGSFGPYYYGIVLSD